MVCTDKRASMWNECTANKLTTPAHTNLTRTPTGAQPLSTLIQRSHHYGPHTHHTSCWLHSRAHHTSCRISPSLLLESPTLRLESPPPYLPPLPFPGPTCAGYAPQHPSRNSGGASVLHWHWLPDLHHHNAAGGCCRAEGSSTRPLPLLAL